MTRHDTAQPMELLIFKLGEQEYSLDIMCVREIRGWARATPMPRAPSYMRGVINLRGTVLPVMDLAERLDLPKCGQSERSVIVVVKHNGSLTGLLVDAVSDIIALGPDDLQPPPEGALQDGPNVISALTLVDDRLVRILDLTHIVVQPESDAA
ncbi:MAG: chemotaxis protein CheW [Pseudomonadota bacterium]